ncbi:MAG: hypothetical protein JWQ02_1392, partial [Capsulimonas sp.]|nr:hypothetical protein [Capsulimonas sp.]
KAIGYGNRGQIPDDLPEIPASYSTPYQLFSPSFGAPHALAWIQEPSSKAMFAEARQYANQPGGEIMLAWSDWNGTQFQVQGFAGHNGTMNIAFCDGHVKGVRAERTAGANGAPNIWGRFDDSPTDSSCPTGTAASDWFNCDGYSAGATHALQVLSSAS